MQSLGAFQEQAFCFFDVGIWNTAVHRTNRSTLLFIEVTNTLGATNWIDDIDLSAFSNCLVWALRLTRSTVDALFGDHRSHDDSPPLNVNNQRALRAAFRP